MLCSIQLENFKAFGQRTVIPLAPITLIFGQNSSGKSSILQSLNLLKQTRESRDVTAFLLPRTETGIVDLGSFQDILFDHDLNRSLSIRLDMSLNAMTKQPTLPRSYAGCDSIGLEMTFRRESLDHDIRLHQLSVFPDTSDRPLVRFHPITTLSASQEAHYEQSRGVALCEYVTSEEDHWKRAFDAYTRERSRCLTWLHAMEDRVEDGWIPPFAFDPHSGESDDPQAIKARFQALLDFFTPEYDIKDFIERLRQKELDNWIILDGFLPSPKFLPVNDPGVLTLLRRFDDSDHGLSLEVDRVGALAGDAVRQLLARIFPLGPVRKPPERYYIFSGATPYDVGFQGHQLPDLLFRHSELVETTNEWLRRLDIGYSMSISSVGREKQDLFEVRLADTRRTPPVEVGLADVGYGISQVLPLVVQSLAGRKQIITIEQPEVHIHPRLQADLGDLLIEGIQAPRNNHFIVETHSEHLALRLQRRVREKKLSPNYISIVYVSRGPNGATVQPLRLDEEGDFMDDFPGGFFPERLRELR